MKGLSPYLRCKITAFLPPYKISMQRLHEPMQPPHNSLATNIKSTNFAALFNIIISYMSKADIEKKKELARTLYLSGMGQNEIAEKIDVSRNTISKWCNAEGWKEARAAKSITRPELVNKLLLTIDTLITQVNESGDPTLIAGLGDKLAKLSAVIEKLDKKANVVDAIEVFMAFSKWIEYRSTIDPEVTPELIKAINKYQDLYITEQMGIK